MRTAVLALLRPLGVVIALASFVAAIAALVRPAGAAPQSWSGGAPRARSIEAIAADPLDANRAWAASFGAGVFRTLDGGATWTAYRTGLTNTYVRALAVQPNHPDSVYCGTNDGIFLSVNGGTSWTKLLATPTSVRAIAIRPVRSGVVYAATNGSGIFKSVNGGASWNPINLGLVNTSVRDVEPDPTKPETLFAATGTGGGIHRSVNGGLSWTQSPDSAANQGAVEQVRFDPLDPNRVYAATLNRGVLKSSDRGLTWARVNRGLTNFNTRSLALADSVRWVGTNGSGVFVTTLADTMWHPLAGGPGTPVVDALLARAGAPAVAWAGTDGGGIFATAVGGASRAQLDGGLLSTYGFALAVRAGAGTVYDGCGFGDQLWRSADGGATWSRAAYLFTHDSVHGLATDPLLPATLYLSAYGSGVYRSDDDGATWFNPDSLNHSLGSSFVRPLVAYPGASGRLFVGGGNGVHETLDGGASWQPVGGGLPASFSVRSLALAPGAPYALYAGSDSAGVWRTADGGVTWAAASNGLPTPFVHSLVADAANALTVFAGTDSGIFRTTDGGANWTASEAGLPRGAGASVRALAQDPSRPNVLFAGLYGAGVFESHDGGFTWASAFGQLGLGNLKVRELAVDGASTTVYAGTDDGVWAMSGYFTSAGVGEPGPGPTLRFAASPNPAGGRVTLAWDLPREGPAELAIFDIGGARVRELTHDARAAAGAHTLVWDGRDGDGRRVAPGTYFARLRTSGTQRTLRVALIGR